MVQAVSAPGVTSVGVSLVARDPLGTSRPRCAGIGLFVAFFGKTAPRRRINALRSGKMPTASDLFVESLLGFFDHTWR
jgi:hypothetical protein